MNLSSDDFSRLNAPPAVEINVRPNILYTEEYSYLTKDELEVLFLLATTEMSAEGLTSFSFSGIKRQLGKHQQKITKAVNRLVSKNLLLKNSIGYSLTAKGTTILSDIVKLQNTVDLHKSSNEFLQQRIIFSSTIALEEVANLLIGKWFGSFRYISHTEGKHLTIRWQLVDSRSSAVLQVYQDEAIISIIPERNTPQKYSYEQALTDLSHYFVDLLETFGIQISIGFEGWRQNSISQMEYQQQLFSWLNSSSKTLTQN